MKARFFAYSDLLRVRCVQFFAICNPLRVRLLRLLRFYPFFKEVSHVYMRRSYSKNHEKRNKRNK
jgi:hypothetical protein